MADTEETEDKKDEFAARDYQVQLADMVIERNKIIFLPTGSGKTFISIMVMLHFLKQNDCGSKKVGEGGKRAFFLVNTVALVQQQQQQIENKTPFAAKGYCGYMGVDFWDKEKWDSELEQHGILVMTAQIFLNLLLGSLITLKDVAVLVFDECHHAVVDHPMRQIMQRFKDVPVNDQPRVLGLTATLINKNLSVNLVKQEIKTLETTFLSQIATADNEELVKMFSTSPREYKSTYLDNDTRGRVYIKRNNLFEKWTHFINSCKLSDVDTANKVVQPIGTIQVFDKAKKTNKELRNVLLDIVVNMDQLGTYGGYVAVLARLIQMQKIIHDCESEVLRTVFNAIFTNLIFFQKILENEMGKRSELELINRYSSPKVLNLFQILEKLKKDDSVIIFVKRRFTAKILHKLLSNAAKANPKLSHIQSDFVVGYAVSNPFKDTKENLVQKTYNDRVLDKFNSGLLNVIVGSNVVEEGMDVSSCNTVIMFDPPMDFRSYVQSKGRARHSTSRYIIMTNDPKFDEKHSTFQKVEAELRRLLCGGQYLLRDEPDKDEIDATLFSNIKGLETFAPLGPNGPTITALSAISHVNRYFANLRTDKFTQITPYWFMKMESGRNGTQYKCYLHLPMESKVKGCIEGTFQCSKENAKRSVALEACKKLFNEMELDQENLLPLTEDARTVNCVSMLPNWDEEEKFKIGTKKSKRAWTKMWPDCLTGCIPEPHSQVYLHLIQHTLMYSPPTDNSRLVAYHQTLAAPVSFAIVSSKRLPHLAPFPLYTSTGELEINILEGEIHSFTDSELAKISIFHGIVFDKICRTVNPFLIRDYSNKENSYLIAPVIVGGGKLKVDWEVIKQGNEPFTSPETIPSEETRRSLEVTEENYLGMIITPWYRPVPATNYLVTKVCHDMSEDSEFPSDVYRTYKDYFADKYTITPLIHQPLLEVRALSSRMNNLKPMTLTKALKFLNKTDNEDLDISLLPEFCHKYPVPGRYWVKARLLPSVLYRVSQLCAAEELRQKLVRDIKIGNDTTPPGKSLKKLEADASLVKHVPSEVKTQQLTPLTLNLQNRGSASVQTTRDPPNIYHNMDDVTLFDIVTHQEFINESVYSEFKQMKVSDSKAPKLIQPPPLKMLQKSVRDPGPEQVQILQAITAAVANDLINCERLETLGDSFLKFSISLTLFETQQDLSEGCLTNVKGQAVGNRNLYFCGRNKQLGNILEVKDFSPGTEWVPPQFCLEETIKLVLIDALLDPGCLYLMNIPEEDVISGVISQPVRAELTDIIVNAKDLEHIQTCVFTNQLGLTDKNISDAVEAIIGVYLENSGIFGALRVMNWFGVIDPELASEKVFTDKMASPTRSIRSLPSEHLVRPEHLEEMIHYKFQDRAYMLQALTHPSFHLNHITQSYQRLEFLGDAIIDFLITIHIYEVCKELHPGDLTDLRSALVNNITLGCIAVRFGLQTFLLHRSKPLYDIMARFVKHQEERGHKIDNDILFLCEEREVKMAESIEVPKALGDLFEALIGAVYLDSGKNIDVTWRVLYCLMREEIETFKKDVPKNHVRMLYESKCQPEFSSHVESDGVVLVKVEVLHQGKTIVCNGFGDNKYQAKRAAAKQALRVIRSSLPQ
ncbi:endoribonuclease Dicer isoform X2 [Macrosteles quadrilineatus]|uniref:endoribonuclease Dicer isoform X2 n=1 Tax=Macrosteles quadrilineatus TaxID=74068 RepID=UPI0023E33F59|nr:endoribonuclease Dicer isoform X2 [Macrosteles quadrilineatus]